MTKWRMAVVVSTFLMFAAAPGWAGSTGNGTAGNGFPQYTCRVDADKAVEATPSFGGAARTRASITSMALDPSASAASTHACPL